MAIFAGDMYDNMLMGGPDDDVLWGGMGDDQLSGGAGDDRLIGGPGADALMGGPGMDTASYTDSMLGVYIDLSTGFNDDPDAPPVRGGDAEGDTLTGIESIWGSMQADRLIGSHAANYLFGNGGNDEINGGRGNDLLRGGDDDDVVGGDEGNDTIYGDMGIDFLMGGMGNDMLFGGMGMDTLEGGMGNDMLEGGMGADEIMGGAGTDTASYTMSAEAVTVNLSVDGSDPEMPRVAGGDAAGDTIGMDVENLRGSMYDDMLVGSNPMMNDPDTDMDESMVYHGKNTIYGNMGNDMLKGMEGDDKLHGGKGMDTLYGGMGDDTLMGEMGDDALKGEDGDDTLVGGPGADKLFGGMFDAATMMAGEDNDMMGDTASYTMSDAGVTIDLSKTSRTMPNPMGEGGHAEGDELVHIEHLTGSMYDDMLEGTDEDNTLKGMDGDDMLTGNGGDDTIDGGKGMDMINGGTGADMLTGGAGDDTFVYTNSAAGNQVDDRRQTTDDGNALNGEEADYRLVDTDAEGDNTPMGDPMVSGGGGMDTIDASSSTAAAVIDLNVKRLVKAGTAAVTDDPGTTDDESVDAVPLEEANIYTSIEKVMGGEGDDILTGNAAAPTTLMGGEGNDSLTGGSMDDMLEGGSGNDTLMGGGGADMLMGGSGNDSLVGGTGADTLGGGTGDDTLTGDSGQDVFVYTGGDDTITDFTVSRAGGDKIDLTALDLSEGQLELIVEAANSQSGTTIYLEFTINDDGTVTAGTAGEHDIELTNWTDGTDLATSDFII